MAGQHTISCSDGAWSHGWPACVKTYPEFDGQCHHDVTHSELSIHLLRILAAENRAQCAGRGLGPGPRRPDGGQTRLYCASGLHPGDEDDDNDDDNDDNDDSIQDRRRGNPAWSWTHNHKEYPTGQFLPHLTLSCFCLLFLAQNIGKYKISPATRNHSLSPRREGCVERTNWRVFVFCIYGP